MNPLAPRSQAFVAAAIVSIFLSLTCSLKAQLPSPTPVSTSDPLRNDLPAGQKAEATPTPSSEVDVWHRENMTGDWGGMRTRWEENGLEMHFSLAGFVQGTTSGGVRHDTEWNGNF